MHTKRDEVIDIAKGIGMVIVVMFHANILHGFWTQFHMPLFAFLSGMVYREKNNQSLTSLKEYVIKKIRTVYVPFVAYNGIFLLLHNFLYRINVYSELTDASLYSVKDIIKKAISIIILGGGESTPGPMWYLIAMLEFTIIYAVIRYTAKIVLHSEKNRDIVTVLICVLLAIIGFSDIDLPRNLNNAFILLFWYNVGYMFYIYREKITIKIHLWLVYFIGLVLLFIGNAKQLAWSGFSYIVILTGLFGITMVYSISEKIKHLNFLKELLMFIGQHTIFILGTHILWFKVAALCQVLVLKYDISWLGVFCVAENEILPWKILYFICGISIPVLILKAKEKLINCGKLKSNT